ncbi:MAG: PepSY domain-containing protein [Porticoccaceae bacterium]|nr:PepSY domain-containing protein [Porticoccaceae bacterium]
MNKVAPPGQLADKAISREVSSLKIWHRRLGLSAATFVLILAISGFFLNHANDWYLDQQTISSSALLDWYGIKQSESLMSYPLDDKFVTRVGDEVFLDTREIAHCTGQLQGALALPKQHFIVIACDNELFVLTEQYEMVERLGAAHSVPGPLDKIGLYQNELVLSAGADHFLADIDRLSWSSLAASEAATKKTINWAKTTATPPALSEALGKHFVGEGITVERLLLDIHSGRIVGAWGIYLIDLMAILFVILAVTGFMMWLREVPRRK